MRAAVEGIDGGADFAEATSSTRQPRRWSPPKAIGRMLDSVEAGELIRAIEREMRK